MSLLFPDQRRLFVSPSEVIGVRLAGWHPRIVQKCRVAVAAGQESENWDNHRVALENALIQLGAGRCPVVISLSNHHLRYRLIPWDDTLVNDDEELALARHDYVEAYGPVADSWRIEVSEQRPRQPRLACAMESSLLSVLQLTVEKFAPGSQLSVQPLLAAVFNGWRRQFGRRHTGWLVVTEPGKLCLAFITDGCWRWVRVINIAESQTRALAELLERESLLAGVGYLPCAVSLFDPHVLDLPVLNPPLQDWVKRLPLPTIAGLSPNGDDLFGLALAGC